MNPVDVDVDQELRASVLPPPSVWRISAKVDLNHGYEEYDIDLIRDVPLGIAQKGFGLECEKVVALPVFPLRFVVFVGMFESEENVELSVLKVKDMRVDLNLE